MIIEWQGTAGVFLRYIEVATFALLFVTVAITAYSLGLAHGTWRGFGK